MVKLPAIFASPTAGYDIVYAVCHVTSVAKYLCFLSTIFVLAPSARVFYSTFYTTCHAPSVRVNLSPHYLHVAPSARTILPPRAPPANVTVVASHHTLITNVGSRGTPLQPASLPHW